MNKDLNEMRQPVISTWQDFLPGRSSKLIDPASCVQATARRPVHLDRVRDCIRPVRQGQEWTALRPL